MKKKILSSAIAIFALLAFILCLRASPTKRTGFSGKPGFTQSRDFKETIACLPGKVLRVDRTQADLTIAAWDRNEISVDARIEVGDSDKEFLTEFLETSKLILAPDAGGYLLRLETPMDKDSREGAWNLPRRIQAAIRSGVWNFSFSARLDIHVPTELALDVKNSFGDVSVRGVSGKHDIRNESGKVRIENCGGDLRLRTSFASAEVVDFKGPVDVNNSSGEVDLKNISGRAEVRNSFKTVTFNRIGGPLTVTSESSDVLGSDVAGDCPYHLLL